MSGKKRAWLRQAMKRICLCGKNKTPFNDEDESPLASIVPSSALPTKPDSIRIPASKTLAASPRFTPDPLTRSYAGAYPPKEASRAASNPFLTDDEVYGPWKQQAEIRHPAVTRCKDQDLETKTKTLRKQSSAASTNTIGWDTPVGEFTAGKQAYHHPTGMLELRNKGSINLLNSLEEAAAKEFQEQNSHQGLGTQAQECTKSPVMLPIELLVEILEHTTLATLFFFRRRASRVFRKWSELFLQKNLRSTHFLISTHNTKNLELHDVVSSRRALSSQDCGSCSQSLNCEASEIIRERRRLKNNARHRRKCVLVTVRFEIEELHGRGLMFYTDPKPLPPARAIVTCEWYTLIELALWGSWIEELRIHLQKRQSEDLGNLLNDPSWSILVVGCTQSHNPRPQAVARLCMDLLDADSRHEAMSD